MIEEKEKTKQHIIISPHPDDEIIGCYEIINNPENSVIIIYSAEVDSVRRKEALKLREYKNNIKGQMFQNSIPPTMISKDENITFYFPDPQNELHPIHRAFGTVGEGMARAGYDVVLYSTLMNVPYIHEVKNSVEKLNLLNKVYTSQSSLWQFDHKYFLFEGRCKWLF